MVLSYLICIRLDSVYVAMLGAISNLPVRVADEGEDS